MRYNKTYKTIAEQADLLEVRGLIIDDRRKAEHYLAKIGYYRLSGYSYVFRQSEQDNDGAWKVLDTFKPNVTFENIKELYVFDKRLRLLLLDALERIEVALRVDVSAQLGLRDRWAYLKPEYLYDSFIRSSGYDRWKQSYDKKYRGSREDFIQHFKGKYDGDLPIWMAVELWDFGMLSVYIGQLKDQYKAPIAETYGINRYALLRNWLHSMNVARNICAHHSRLWNRVLPVRVGYPNAAMPELHRLKQEQVDATRLYPVLCTIQYFMRQVSPNSQWGNRLVELIDAFPESEYTSIQAMGIPQDWKDWPLWQSSK
ncbi:MAG: Abi family protein [Rickettsiales bacterium]|nr:Abi family protein [Rickettsiales bacterium]